MTTEQAQDISDERLGDLWRMPDHYMRPISFARAVLALQERADVVPPGMVLVPIEPTDAMWDAAVREENRVFRLWPGQHPSCFQIWKAMVAASQDSDIRLLGEDAGRGES